MIMCTAFVIIFSYVIFFLVLYIYLLKCKFMSIESNNLKIVLHVSVFNFNCLVISNSLLLKFIKVSVCDELKKANNWPLTDCLKSSHL